MTVVKGTTLSRLMLGQYMTEQLAPLTNGRPVDEATAAKLGASRQTITRMLNGTHLMQWKRFLTVLGNAQLTDAEHRRAIELYRLAESDEGGVAPQHARNLPIEYVRYRQFEHAADTILTVDTFFIPGLLQTADYAQAASASFHRTINGESWNAEAASERRDRQAILYHPDNPVRLHCLIDESALRRAVGGPSTMHAQLNHLVEQSSCDNVTIQVIPASAGAYGTQSAVFILRFPRNPEFGTPLPDAAFIESQTGMSPVGEGEPVEVLTAVWHDASALALSPTDSVSFVQEIKRTFEGER